jgi:hypothetical protein
MSLAIRDEQMAVLRREAMRGFKDRTVERLRSFAPRHFEQPGEIGVRRAVDVGVEQAFAYGLTAESAVHFYIEMMFILGSGFDKDPMFPWAGQILNDATIVNQHEKSDRLYDKTSDYLSRSLGKSNEYYYSALRRIRQEFLGAEVRLDSMRLDNYAAAAFYKMYPEKCAYLGDTVVRILAARGARKAISHGINSDQGSFVLGTLMFLLGCDVCHDPLHPWVGEALAKDNPLTADERVERLYEGGASALDHCLS